MRKWSYVWLICFTRVTLWCAHSKTYRPVIVIVIRDYCVVVDCLCSGRTESRRSCRSFQLDSSFRYSHTCLAVLTVNAKVLSSWWWSRWTLGDLFQGSVCDCKHDCTLFDCDWVMLRWTSSFVTVIVIRNYWPVVDYLCSRITESRRSWRSLQLDDSFRFSHTRLVNTLYGWYSFSKSGSLLVFTRSNLSIIFWRQQTSFVSRKTLGRQWSFLEYLRAEIFTEAWVLTSHGELSSSNAELNLVSIRWMCDKQELKLLDF